MRGIIRGFVNFLQGIPKLMYFIALTYFTDKDKTLIPCGDYCYKINRVEGSVIYTSVCPYYYYGHGYKRGCIYTGEYGYDILLNDQVKICGVNNEG